MRLKRALAVGALLVLSTSVAACGDDNKDSGGVAAGAGNSDGDGKSTGGAAAGGLPSATSVADISDILNQHGSCLDLQSGDKYDAGSFSGTDPAWDIPDERPAAVWGVKERYVCRDNYSDSTTMALVDMKKFQAAYKTSGLTRGVLVGKNFLVVPGGAETAHDLQASGLKYFTCDPKFQMPSGYKKEPALVDGCVVTNYFSRF
ncbi:hypothetical protein [Streptomyces durhamensis]|uniref:hypothetical protein n=1 Tax=Streptomyces durhamensis TaxID=68194 RepID=UPI0004CDB4B9|nr:hypothetical protein [Streptomyces durhamensis]